MFGLWATFCQRSGWNCSGGESRFMCFHCLGIAEMDFRCILVIFPVGTRSKHGAETGCSQGNWKEGKQSGVFLYIFTVRNTGFSQKWNETFDAKISMNHWKSFTGRSYRKRIQACNIDHVTESFSMTGWHRRQELFIRQLPSRLVLYFDWCRLAARGKFKPI